MAPKKRGTPGRGPRGVAQQDGYMLLSIRRLMWTTPPKNLDGSPMKDKVGREITMSMAELLLSVAPPKKPRGGR